MKERSDNGTILIVDDESTNIGVLYEFLMAQNFKVLVSQDANSTFEILNITLPDLILLDVRLEDMDGFEVCRRIKLNQKFSDIPIIFISALNDVDSKIRGFEVGGVDYITKPVQYPEVLARINAHLTIRKQQKVLKKLNASKDRLFSILSHDLRSPFLALNGFSELLVQSLDTFTKDEIKDIANRIMSTGKNTLKLLEDILKWANLQRDKFEYEIEDVVIEEIIEMLLMLMREAASSKNLCFNVKVPKNAVIRTDKNIINTVLRNLIGNAIKFSKDGGTITIGLENTDKYDKLFVKDEGVGMDDDIKLNLFQLDTVVTKPGTKGEKGTGLGLILCKELIEKIEGKIVVESEIGKGTTISIIIPK